MLTLTHVDPLHSHFAEVLRHDFDEMVGLVLAPWAIDFSHMDFKDETWM